MDMKQIITDCDNKFDNVRDLVNFVVLTQKVKSQLDNKLVNINFGKNAEYYQKMLTEFTNLFYKTFVVKTLDFSQGMKQRLNFNCK